MTSSYDKLAPYYDRFHEALTADVEFVLSLAQQQDGPVLEMGCGTGRLLLPLARAGFEVTGIDTSAAMLASPKTLIRIFCPVSRTFSRSGWG